MISVFHDPADPYNHLLVQALAVFATRYDVELAHHLVPPPEDWAVPERDHLAAWSLRDARALAARADLDPPGHGTPPSPDRIAQAGHAMAAALDAPDALARLVGISHALWTGGETDLDAFETANAEAEMARGAQARADLGHYLGAMLHYGGEWYWGIDRLHFLEARLGELGLRRAGAPETPIYPPDDPRPPQSPAPNAPDIHFFLSFRSPYTYLAAERIFDLARAHGAEVQLRFVLPMVMRNLQVPRMKGRYILFDVSREARRLHIPFGNIADPLGKPVERGYAILPWAIGQGQGEAFVRCFLRGVWAEGIDAGSDRGLKRIVERADLDWGHARSLLDNDDWRAVAEANRKDLLAHGHWGVPSFRVCDTTLWGQDRLWAVHDALMAAERA
jgi:2-hydroxychromene-2-carboxylate isomerase